MAKAPPRKLQVTAVRDLTLNMRRITFTGEAIKDYPNDREGGYVKLFLQYPESSEVGVRTYTIRHLSHAEQSIDVDFVTHGDHGLASAWAQRAQVGEVLEIGGPGPAKPVASDSDWYFFVGDMTSLPAISVNLESLPSTAKGHAVIEVLHEEDIQKLTAPEGIELHWLVIPAEQNGLPTVVDLVRQLEWLPGKPDVWVATEFETMRALRQYFRKERLLSRFDTYTSSYWKLGVAEDQHKRIKRQDADSDAA